MRLTRNSLFTRRYKEEVHESAGHHSKYLLDNLLLRMSAITVLLLTFAVACEYTEDVYPERIQKNSPPVFRKPGSEVKQESIFGSEGLAIFLGKEKQHKANVTIAVNNFLWRASLDAISFMPMNSVDPFGGVIITDWYVPPESPHERFKVNVYILSHELRSDGVKVSAFRQVHQPDGGWYNAPIDANRELEDAILTRARQLRLASAVRR